LIKKGCVMKKVLVLMLIVLNISYSDDLCTNLDETNCINNTVCTPAYKNNGNYDKCEIKLSTNLSCMYPSETPFNKVAINELYSQGSSANYNMLEIYFNEDYDLSDLYLHFQTNKGLQQYKLGSGVDGTKIDVIKVTLPNGNILNNDNAGTIFSSPTKFPKGTFIAYQLDNNYNLISGDGEVAIVQKSGIESNQNNIILDHMTYGDTTYYYNVSSTCSTHLTLGSGNFKDISRLTDGSGGFYEQYPNCTTNCDITISESSSNLAGETAGSYFTTDIDVNKSVNKTIATLGDTIQYNIKITNKGNYTATNIKVRDIFPTSILDYSSSNTYFNGLNMSCGTILINGSNHDLTIPTLPTNSYCNWDITAVVKNTLTTTINAENSLYLISLDQQDDKSENNISSTTTLVQINSNNNYNFDAWDLGNNSGNIVIDRNITTKIVNKPFNLTIASLDNTTNPVTFKDINISAIKASLVKKTDCPNVDKNITPWIDVDFTNSERNQTTKSFNLNSAYKDLKVQFNKDGNLSCSTNNFAIRPKYFEISTYSKRSDGKIVAGDIFTLQIIARDEYNQSTDEYNESISFLIDYNETKVNCKRGIFNGISGKFIDGNFTKDINYSEIGEIDINVSEIKIIGSEFANVDIDDTPDIDKRLIEYNQTRITINPASIELNNSQFSVNPNFGDGNKTFMADIYESNVIYKADVIAVDICGTMVQNFNDLCYATDVNVSLDVNLSTLQNNKYSFIYEINNIKYIEGNFTQDDLNLTDLNISEGNFTQDRNYSDIQFLIAVPRLYNEPKNPIKIDFHEVNLSRNGIFEDDDEIDKNITFYYGRVFAEDKDIVGNSISTKVGLELYCNSSSNPSCGSFGLSEDYSSQNLNWWNFDINLSNVLDANATKEKFSTTYGDINLSNNFPYKSDISFIDGKAEINATYKGTTYPHQTTIHLNIPSYLWYSKYGSSYEDFNSSSLCYKNHPCFNVIFRKQSTPSTGNWSGSGADTGYVVDENMSSRTQKRINW